MWLSNIARALYNAFCKDEIKATEDKIKKLEKEINSLTEDLVEAQKQINSLKNLIAGGSLGLKEPDVKGSISMSQLKTLLNPHCKNIYCSDVNYGLATKTAAKDFTRETKVWIEKYVSGKHDCDEFSFSLMGYWNTGLKQFAFGIAWSKTHAFNIMVDYQKQIWIVEPQSNSWYKIEDITEYSSYYPLEVVMI